MNRTQMRVIAGCALAALLPTTFLIADDITAPASIRFKDKASQDVPDFQQHVVPLLGRLGCNGRSCHGSFQGRGGMRLSLFGYDFNMDHSALTARSSSGKDQRVDRTLPEESLALLKPLMEIDHKGGKRFSPGSWPHHLLRRWVESGATGVAKPRELSRLEVTPSAVVFDRNVPEDNQLRVIAIWKDGHREDVTPLCRFRTNNDAVVTVNKDGILKSIGPGDSHVIAFYDNGVVAVPVLRPVTDHSIALSAPVTANKIDKLVWAKISKLGIVASELCSDSEFLRRVSIDLTGTLPTPDEVEAFVRDRSKRKRQVKIDELLERPAYAAWWTNKLCDFTGCNPRQQAELGQEVSVQWYTWIYSRLRENVPYDELIQRIVLARGRSEGQSYHDYAEKTSAYFRDESPSDFAQRETMPHYWTRRTMQKPQESAQAFAHNFLGIRLQCAQCHKHPFAPWTQNDFTQFSEFFENVKFGVAPDSAQHYRKLAQKVGLNSSKKDGVPIRNEILQRARTGGTIPWRELYISKRPKPATLSLLRGGIVELSGDSDPRESILKWMLQPENPWFARAFVNRVWAGYFNVGIIDPPDDLNPANPPSNPELIDWLATSFVEHDYDMKWIHREIVSSHTYQRSWRPNKTNRDDVRNFSRAIPRRVPAEVVYDGVKQAVAATSQLDEVRSDLTRRAIGHLSMRLAGTYAMQVFGKPERAVNCDCERDNKLTLLQSVFLQNDPLIDQRLEDSGWLKEISQREESGKQIDREALVRDAWLRTLSRPPTEQESARGIDHLSDAPSLTDGIRDLLWALINTKEFLLN